MFFSHLQSYKLEYIFYTLVVGITLFLSYPSWLSFSHVSYGVNHPDHLGTLWGFWWMQYSFQAKLPYEQLMIAQPFGWEKELVVTQPLWFFLVRVLSFFLNHIATYNLFILLSFPLTFLTCFLFLKQCAQDKLASYIG